MTLMSKAAEGVTWHAVDRVHDFRFGACGEPLDLGRQMHHSLVADHVRCQRAACSAAWGSRPVDMARAEAGEGEVGGVLLIAVVLVVAVILGGVVPLAVWPWLAYGGLALFVSGCFMIPKDPKAPRRRR